MSDNLKAHSDSNTASRDPRAWVAPLLSTLLTLPAAGFAWFYGALSPMACDSCDGAEADRFDASYGAAWGVLCTGLVVALVVMLVSWCVPWERRHAAKRALLAVAAPVVVGAALVAFLGMVDWP
ncbi:hypothetical protein AB0M10_32480 [Streptomyces sp. NPDC051840]|uniref:hypothetical protein n=1 Tax=Streptomyces sp. NPDC051840 TaxID=3154752 RepID=UPI0034250D3D